MLWGLWFILVLGLLTVVGCACGCCHCPACICLSLSLCLFSFLFVFSWCCGCWSCPGSFSPPFSALPFSASFLLSPLLLHKGSFTRCSQQEHHFVLCALTQRVSLETEPSFAPGHVVLKTFGTPITSHNFTQLHTISHNFPLCHSSTALRVQLHAHMVFFAHFPVLQTEEVVVLAAVVLLLCCLVWSLSCCRCYCGFCRWCCP